MGLTLSAVETGADGRWTPGIGDPTWMGWVTVVAYVVAAYFAWAACKKSRCTARAHGAIEASNVGEQRQLAAFWFLMFIALALLGINKQLDLQSLFTEVMRDLALRQGWYDERRKFQFEFVVGIAAVAIVGVGVTALLLRRVWRHARIAVLGMGWLLAFVVIRAASFHHVEVLLSSNGKLWNFVFETSGIALIGLCGYRVSRPDRIGNVRSKTNPPK